MDCCGLPPSDPDGSETRSTVNTGPDLLALFELVLAGLVQHLVVRHDEVGLRADLEAVRGDVHALPDEGIEFFHEHDGIKDDAVSDQADFAFV